MSGLLLRVLALFLGGLRVDLRGARLDPAGATLDVNTLLGGLEVLVPEDWAVDVDEDVRDASLEVRVTSPDDLPEDAPRLKIQAAVRMGGAEITAKST